MPLSNNIVDYINHSLQVGAFAHEKFQPSKWYNTAVPVQFENDEKGFVAPGVISHDGDIEAVMPDEDYNLQVYHKSVTNTYLQLKSGSGDDRDYQSTSDMLMFVFAQRDKIRLTPEDLESKFIFSLPSSFENSPDGIPFSCKIIPVSSDMDKLRNGRTEFENVPNFFKPEHIFFSIRYQIIKKFGRGCIDACKAC